MGQSENRVPNVARNESLRVPQREAHTTLAECVWRIGGLDHFDVSAQVFEKQARQGRTLGLRPDQEQRE
jgi:hypothetical protein